MQVSVNGETRQLDIASRPTLLQALRDDLGLHAAKYACGEGACGACTVLLDGVAVRSCVTPVDGLEGRAVTTLEGLADDDRANRLQAAFVREAAMQCGYCIPGMIVAATPLLRSEPEPGDEQTVAALDGNICRCGAYSRILRAVRGAARTAPEPPVSAPLGRDSGRWSARPVRPWDLTAPEDRDTFDRLGNGLLVVLPPDEADRVNEQTGGAWSTGGGAWIHVGADGRIAAFTGKVDVGQDN